MYPPLPESVLDDGQRTTKAYSIAPSESASQIGNRRLRQQQQLAEAQLREREREEEVERREVEMKKREMEAKKRERPAVRTFRELVFLPGSTFRLQTFKLASSGECQRATRIEPTRSLEPDMVVLLPLTLIHRRGVRYLTAS